MAMSKEQENVLVGIGVAMWVFFFYGLYCLFTPMEESKGIGLMLATMILQNWKRNIQRMTE